ncbi:MAG TPA: DUF4440 domain-containing protein [Gemmatimonadaceae bacterium]
MRKASDARTEALRAGNAREWARYTTDDFTVTGTHGTVTTKAQRIAEIDGHPATGTPPTIADRRWREHGSAVIETFSSTGSAGNATRIMSVWVRDGGLWKVAAVQLTAVDSTAAAAVR